MVVIPYSSVLQTLFLILLDFFHKGLAIKCFECVSVDGNIPLCEDHFGPYNITGHLLKNDCRVGVLHFEAFYCVKIKGIKDNGQTVIIRTCSVDNWGTQCGDLLFEQGDEKMQPITGCLASCDHDGCNTGSRTKGHMTFVAFVTSMSILWLKRV